MGTVVAVLGLSGAGKDTFAGCLAQAGHKVKVIKFSRWFKDALAGWLGVTYEQLEDREYRATVIPELGVSPLDILVNSYHYMPHIAPGLGLYHTKQRVAQALNQGYAVVFTDCRSTEEAEYIASLGKDGHYLALVDIVRDGALALSPDANYHLNARTIACYATTYTRVNNTSLDVLHSAAMRLL